jgi:hypothetical protein
MTVHLDLKARLHGHAIAFAADQDRRWFASHPFASFYEREPFEHELCDPRSDACTPAFDVPDGHRVRIRVYRLSAHCRGRQPVLVRAT